METETSPELHLPAGLKRFLEQQRIHYRVTANPPSRGLRSTGSLRCRSVALEDEKGTVLALVPEDHLVDIRLLNEMLGRELRPMKDTRLRSIFPDCSPDCPPPLGQPYAVETVVDIGLYTGLELSLQSGRAQARLLVPTRDLQQAVNNCPLGRFSYPASPDRDNTLKHDQMLSDSQIEPALAELFPGRAMRSAERCRSLPVLPTTAWKILEVTADIHAGARDLKRVIEQDPSISARLLQCANAPAYGFFGFSGRVSDLDTAIARILGFDRALAIAFGMSLHQVLGRNGPDADELESYHRNTVYRATLAKYLAGSMPSESGVTPGTAYMAGLLHNIGLLFLACNFPEQYRLLLHSAQLNPGVPLVSLESSLLEISHQELGGHLLEGWGLPGELIVAARHHHDTDYDREHSGYSQLMRLCSALVPKQGLLAGHDDAEPDRGRLTERLGLNDAAVEAAMQRLADAYPLLDELAQRLAA
ncbi:aminoacyl-tRNA deacylase and HDOD domain-containing protein [Thiohalobacter thiocyanaticus]|uniref:HDOD domain-containing protein n=1 Tax=Thiohalobacter thiocyanaticus TaxID=585455 RepID=A0A426QI56_9GAMM|nr:HDOD domain-containing protein [Thiohalobacter thiocyanaticus]RRQ21429.1 HDOD domain-containing protein [Thiohalobacter thiocyanaticus]